MHRFITIFCLLIGVSFANSQEGNLGISIEYKNFEKKINDLQISLHVKGGTPPYIYQWSEQSIPLTSSVGNNLTEGKNYNIQVIDSKGKMKTINAYFAPQYNDEKINAFFTPIVNAIGNVLMADIFSLLGLYDPIMYDEYNKPLLHPNGTPRKNKIPLVVVWLILGALFFTIKMKFINIRGFNHAIQLVRGKYDNPNDKGEVTHFQALASALSATVGLGNIAGVAIAIAIGGPGATFWMIVAGLLGMSSKFVECTLGVKYRNIDKKGVVSGGAMYYLSKGFAKHNMKIFGQILAIIFSILVIGASFGGGNMFQANQAFSQFSFIFPDMQSEGTIFGVILAILVGVVIIGGIKSIARVTEKVVPFMAVLYVTVALVIVFMNITHIREAFLLIINGAFNPSSIKGGIAGVLILGFQRAAFSNEAGIGSAAIAHAAVKTKEPITEGIVALLEPFIDTVVICTMTALVIIFTGFYNNPNDLAGVELTSQAFGSIVPWFPYVLVIAIFLFAFSTMITWSYYGLNGFVFLFGKFTKRKKLLKNIYFSLFLIFTIIGSSSNLGAVLDFSDMMILAMAFPNIIGLVIMSSEVKLDLKNYFKKFRAKTS